MTRPCPRRTAAALVLLLPARLALAEVFPLVPEDDVVGATARIRAVYEDTLVDIGRRHGLGYEEITRANPGVDSWLPGDGTEVLLPTRFVLPAGPREGMVVNIAEYRLYFYGDAGRVATFPISIGRMDWATPLGRAALVSKVRNPAWYPPQSIRDEHAADGRPLPRVVPPGPDNPLGGYAMRLSVPGYLIHGTNRPAGVGMRVTHGCIRMFPEDIEWLFDRARVNMRVELVNQPYKFGWHRDALYFEAHAPLEEDTAAQGMTAVIEAYVRATRERAADVDWDRVEAVYRAQRGFPVEVGGAAPPGEPARTVGIDPR